MKHKVVIADASGGGSFVLRRMIRRAVQAALAAECITLPCRINVLLVDDAAIQKLNQQFRQIDRPTDVLSFPLLQLSPGDKPGWGDLAPGEQTCELGDMVISLERARAQAAEYGHSLSRELCYLAVHSVLHLLGYDHVDEGAMKAQMRAREEKILSALHLSRQ